MKFLKQENILRIYSLRKKLPEDIKRCVLVNWVWWTYLDDAFASGYKKRKRLHFLNM